MFYVTAKTVNVEQHRPIFCNILLAKCDTYIFLKYNLFLSGSGLNRSSVPFACRKRRLHMDGPLDKTAKTEAKCHNRGDMIKIPSYPEAVGAENSPIFCSFSRAMMTSPYGRNILERGVQQRQISMVYSCICFLILFHRRMTAKDKKYDTHIWRI